MKSELKRLRCVDAPRTRGTLLTLALLVPWLASAEVLATDYVFTKIVDNSGDFSNFGLPTINNQGAVAFQATKDSGVIGIYLSDSQGFIEVIEDSTGEYETFDFAPQMNNHSQVAFWSELDSGETRIAVGSVGTPTQVIAETSAATEGFSSIGPAPVVNDSGLVAFAARRNSDPPGPGHSELITRQYPNPASVAVDTSGDFRLFFVPFINDAGQMVFFASYDEDVADATGNPSGIFRRDADGTIHTLDQSITGVKSVFPIYGIGDDGRVAYQYRLSGSQDQFLAISTGGAPTLIADTLGDFDNFSDVQLNNLGQIAFGARLNSGDNAIFAGDDSSMIDPVANRVIGPGDSLFGSEVIGSFFGKGLNDAGQIVFVYGLENDEFGIAVATPVLAGDYNQNGVVDGADFLLWQQQFGQTGPGLAADGNSDGTVNGLDLAIWEANFGTAAPSPLATATAIPEPSTLWLLLIGAGSAWRLYLRQGQACLAEQRRAASAW